MISQRWTSYGERTATFECANTSSGILLPRMKAPVHALSQRHGPRVEVSVASRATAHFRVLQSVVTNSLVTDSPMAHIAPAVLEASIRQVSHRCAQICTLLSSIGSKGAPHDTRPTERVADLS